MRRCYKPLVWETLKIDTLENLLIECRFVADETRESPGRLTGVLLTYGETSRDRPERFLRDSLHWLDSGIVVNEQHVRANAIMRVTPFLDGDTLRIDQPLPNTQRGRDAATNIRDGLYTGLSVEFAKRGVVASYVGGVREIRSAQLVGAGLVDLASYPGSTVEVRESGDGNHALEVLLRCL